MAGHVQCRHTWLAPYGLRLCRHPLDDLLGCSVGVELDPSTMLCRLEPVAALFQDHRLERKLEEARVDVVVQGFHAVPLEELDMRQSLTTGERGQHASGRWAHNPS
jgi:hypothetical protein